MSTRGLDANGDWLFGKGTSDYVTSYAELQQNIQTSLLMVLGDCFFATNVGVDWFNLLGSKNTLSLQLAISAQLLTVYGVTGINSVNFTLTSNRVFTITYSVNTYLATPTNPNGTIATSTGYILDESGNIITTEDGSQILA